MSYRYKVANDELHSTVKSIPKWQHMTIAFSTIKKNNVENCLVKVSKGAKIRKSIQSSTIPDPGYQFESNKLTVRHHKLEPRGQPFPSR